ncbi:MAG: hypothetical protein GF350_12390 [Chitinivibrionales bacterium]|nr:hypothetical protein [Chitinivibrionales bacterium]
MVRAYRNWLADTRGYDEYTSRGGNSLSATTDWYKCANKYNWEARAEAYDRHQIRKFAKDEEAIRARLRQERLTAQMQALNKAYEAAVNADPSETSLKDAATVIQKMSREMRAELGDDVEEHRFTIDVMLQLLPNDLRNALLESLEGEWEVLDE